MKLKISEIFYSAQGEGRFIGVPSVFLRTFGCNFTCAGFGCAPGVKSTEADEVAKNVHLYKDFLSLPLVNTGCDSYASWHPAFKDLSPTKETSQLVDEMLALTPNHKWVQDNGNDVHLVITGGEPLLGWQRSYPALLDKQRDSGLRHVTFETNGTQLLQQELRDFITDPILGDRIEYTFSISPKLSASGEAWDQAIKPLVVADYENYGFAYLKFVVDCPAHFDEADQAVTQYRDAGFMGPAYVMPVGGVVSVYDGNKFNIAEEALKRGYHYSPRLHVDIWGNSWAA